MKNDPHYDLFIKFLRDNNYSHIEYPLNTRYSDMFIAFKEGIIIDKVTKSNKKK